MKSTGIVRRIDDLGRICLPKELRDTYGMGNGDAVEIFTDNHGIYIRKYAPGCKMCGAVQDVFTVSNVLLCRPCITKIAGAAKSIRQ